MIIDYWLLIKDYYFNLWSFKKPELLKIPCVLCNFLQTNYCFIWLWFQLQVLPWPLMSTLNASDEIFRLLESPFATFIGRGDLKQATQLVIAVLKSLEQQESGIISKEERIEVVNRWQVYLALFSLCFRGNVLMETATCASSWESSLSYSIFTTTAIIGWFISFVCEILVYIINHFLICTVVVLSVCAQ